MFFFNMERDFSTSYMKCFVNTVFKLSLSNQIVQIAFSTQQLFKRQCKTLQVNRFYRQSNLCLISVFCCIIVREYGCNLVSPFFYSHHVWVYVSCVFEGMFIYFIFFYLQGIVVYFAWQNFLFARLLFYLILDTLIYFYLSICFVQYREMALHSPTSYGFLNFFLYFL